MNVYDTLHLALTDVAKRSFYEDCIVIPLTEPGEEFPTRWEVRDDCNTINTDDVHWSHIGGLEVEDNTDHTRLMDSAELFDDGRHIAYHFAGAEELLTKGTTSIAFAYAIVNDLDYSEFNDDEDTIAGWVLLAREV